jgi:hypothetical protein
MNQYAANLALPVHLQDAGHIAPGLYVANGTSMAAPHVAGVAALLLSLYPNATPFELKQAIMMGADDMLVTFPNGSYMGKRLNAHKALKWLQPPVLVNPTIITTQQQLSNIRNNPSGHYQLGSDIVLTGQWNPIMQLNANGILCGNGFRISNMNLQNIVVTTAINYGLFGNNFGTIMNLQVTGDMLFPVDYVGPWTNIGIVAGENNGKIINVHAGGKLFVYRERSILGGIVGRNYGLIDGSSFGIAGSETQSSYIESFGDVGGIAGDNLYGGIIKDSVVSGVIIGHYIAHTPNNFIGGIVGYSHSAVILNSHTDFVWVINSGFLPGGTPNSRAPFMGIAVGRLSSSAVWNVSRTFWCSLDQGSLTTNAMRANFGRVAGGLVGNTAGNNIIKV